MNTRTHSFKLRNPYKPDEILTQEVILSEKLQYDYSDSKWIAVDGEFLGLNQNRDKLCCVQIASPDQSKTDGQRVEIVYTYNQSIDEKLKSLFSSKIEKIFHVFTSDVPMIEKYLGIKMSGPMFDTKVAANIAWTNGPSSGLTDVIKAFIDPKFEKGGLSYSRWELPIEKWSKDMIEYCAKDVLYLDRFRQKMTEIAQDRDRLDILDGAMSVLPEIAHLYTRGFDVGVFRFN